jgi:iron complex transport system substrate-binding protein
LEEYKMSYPQRIVCLTTEPTEVLYLLGEQARIVGISGFTTRPAIARKEKPKIAAFTSAKIDKILALKPDLVIGFSNLQADIAASLIRAGVEVHIFNQRSIAQMLSMVATVGSLVGASDKAAKLIDELEQTIEQAKLTATQLPVKPTIYFEEWNDPIICSIKWASELIEMAGGIDCFPELSQFHSAKDRTIQASQVIERQPDIIIGSWCGKKFQPEQVIAREGWNAIPAVKNGFVFEIKSTDILQPGPSLITHGLKQVQSIIQQWASAQPHHKQGN